jgi:hypothetical protein
MLRTLNRMLSLSAGRPGARALDRAVWRFLRLVTGVVAVIAAGLGGSWAAGLESSGAPGVERCRTISDSAARLRCYEDATADPSRQRGGSSSLTGGWRLVRTRNPRGDEDAVSVMHTADLFRSDPDLAGLTLRCGEAGIEVLVILLQTFSPRAKPQVSLSATGENVHFTASVSLPGTALILPAEATALASGPWQNLSELGIEVDNESRVIRGVIPLEGLRDALQTLRVNCSSLK